MNQLETALKTAKLVNLFAPKYRNLKPIGKNSEEGMNSSQQALVKLEEQVTGEVETLIKTIKKVPQPKTVQPKTVRFGSSRLENIVRDENGKITSSTTVWDVYIGRSKFEASNNDFYPDPKNFRFNAATSGAGLGCQR